MRSTAGSAALAFPAMIAAFGSVRAEPQGISTLAGAATAVVTLPPQA